MTTGRSPGATVLLFGLPLAVFLALAVSSAWVCDDAFIAFRYGRNFAEGLGLRFNLGVEPPVEGYTQLGWVLWLALVEKLGRDPTVWAPGGSIAAGAVLLLWLLAYGRRRLELGAVATLAAGLFFATAPSVVVWSSGGLGTMPFALAIFAAAERLLGDPERPRVWQAAVALLFVVLLRADGVYWVALILGYALLRSRAVPVEARSALVRGAFACGGVVAVAVGAQLAFRLGYYGDWLPNTVRAKVGMSVDLLRRGACYLVSYWLTIPAVALAFVLGASFCGRRVEHWLRVSAVLIAGTFLYGVLVGGDFMAMGRFFVPAAPFLALVVGRLAQLAAARFGGVAAGALGVVLLGLSVPVLGDVHLAPRAAREACAFRWQIIYQTEYEFWRGMDERAQQWSDLGRALGEHADPDASIVRVAIGAVGYYSRLFVYDRAGLVNREVVRDIEIADPLKFPSHDRVAKIPYFASYKPTYAHAVIVYGPNPVRPWPRASRSEVIPIAAADGYLADGFVTLSFY
ncbi:MAG: hypothetical protein AAF682_23720 [Planctomycetota bacterium]